MNERLIPQFCCDFVTNNSLDDNCFHCDSYLRQNQLKWLLEKNDNYYNVLNYNQTIDLFDLKINSNDFNSKQMEICFSFLKKTFNKLRDISTKRSLINGSVDNDYRKLRDNVCTFLAFLRRRLFEICIKCEPNISQMESKNTFCVSVLKEMLNFLSFVGRLSKIGNQLIDLALNSDPKTPIFNYFHSYLDIWCAAIELMYILDQNKEINFSDLCLLEDESSASLSSQTIQLVLFDLIILSVNRFNDIKESNKYQKLSLFNCFCVKQMYVLVRHMFDAIHKSSTNESKDSFFEHIFSSYNRLTSSQTNRRSVPLRGFKLIFLDNHLVKEPNLHFIWFVTNIVQTFNYDISGQFSQSSTLPTIPLQLSRKIPQFLKQNDSQFNENISAIICFYLNSINFWKPNTDSLHPFIQHFLKNLSKNYFKTNVEELAFIPKTSTKWLQIIAEITSHRNNCFIDNCFYLFLSLMSQQLSVVFERSDSKTKQSCLQKLKGRAVVAVYSNQLDTLDETAIYNLFSFYLVLMKTNDEIWAEFIDVIFETIVRLNNNPNQLELVLKLMFALIQIKPKTLSAEKISAFIGKTFNDFCEQNVKNLSHKSVTKIIILYFDEMKNLIESKCLLNSNFENLLNIKFNSITSLRPTTDQMFVFVFIDDLLKEINQNLDSNQIECNITRVIETCFGSILPLIKQEINHKNNYQILSEIAFSFTKISNYMSQKNSQKLYSIFIGFLPQNNCQFVCNYLCLITQNSELIKSLNKESDFSSNLIRNWCRLLVSPHISQPSIDELSYRLSYIIEDLRSDITPENPNSFNTFFVFVKNLTKKLSNYEMSAKISAIQRAGIYFQDMIYLSANVIKNFNDLNSIKRIYGMISRLMSIASQLLYIPSTTNCLLPKMIDSIIIPVLLNEVKLKLSPILQKAFPYFIEGLFKLECDPYIERQIRRIISFYLLIFVNRPNAYINLKNQLEERKIYNLWTKHLLSTIVQNFFHREESVQISLIPFIEEFCKFDLNADQLIAVFNGALLKVPFNEPKTKESLLSLIGSISQVLVKQKKERILLDNQVFNQYIETNLSNERTLSRLFSIITIICKCCPNLLHDLIGQITRTIEANEKKRCVGTDFRLRNALRDFANQKL